MKTLNLLLVFLTILIAGCRGDAFKDFLPGTYVSSASGEYGVSNDTLVIHATEGNNYVIDRVTSYGVKTDKGLKWQYEMEKWQVLYNEKAHSLTELRNGKVIVPYPDSGKVVIGKRIYRKLTTK